jgi:D-inositol-3-phosphate glycosyltransferase
MNIVQVSGGELRIPVEKGGGMEVTIVGISKHLVKAGHSVTILDRKYSPADPDVEYLDGIKIVRLRARRFPKFKFNFTINFVLNQLSFAYNVKKHLAKADFDIIQAHVSVSGLFLAITDRKLREKLYYLSQTARRVKNPPSLLDRMALALENQFVKRTRKTVVQNEIAREKLIRAAGMKPEDVVFISTGTDTNKFNPNLDVGDIRQRYGLDNRVNILFVGRINPDKGVVYLVKAADIVINEFSCKDAFFLLVGPTGQFTSGASARSPYLAKVVKFIEDYGLKQNVRLTGALPIDDLRKLYVACDIFVLPSLTEAMPTASLEAMASGKPVIGTKVGGILMQIQDGKSGFLVDPADGRQLAEKIKYLIDNPSKAKEMGAYGRKLAEEKFDWAIIAERLLQVYQS